MIRKVNQLYIDDKNVKVFFGNGGDRTMDTTPEMEYCEANNVEMIWGVGGGKIQSSSDLIRNSKVM